MTPSDRLLAQADLALVLARLWLPPGADSLALLTEAAANASWLALAAGLPPGIAASLHGARDSAIAFGLDAWAAEYNRLFDTAVACPIHEGGYVRRDRGPLLGDIAGFYRAFGFELDDGAGTRVDHLACELEFVSMLLVMLERAPGTAEAEVTRDALAAFASDHLGDWLPTFCAGVCSATEAALFGELATLLDAWWRAVIVTNEVPEPVVTVPATAETDPGTPYECGMEEP